MMTHARKGSALLIVLGMIAFMVVSAVAFSAYMRAARLPSSFLRRSVASRMLVKAALAEAIDEIDRCVADNPHPGVGVTKARRADSQYSHSESGTRNTWISRVLVGTNLTASSKSGEISRDDIENVLVARSKTVPTLSLEGMAYVPPPITDDVRYYSRRTPTAVWHRMNFDAGRYAFTAIDVSDFFDVNVVRANSPRSSAPGSRITLAHLFENAKHTSYDRNKLKEWDSFVDRVRNDSSSMPLFASFADFNLALKQGGPSEWKSPFCEYVSGSGTSFNGTPGGTSDLLKRWTSGTDRMPFVTDSLFPEETDNSVLDLMEEGDGNQPFPPEDLENGTSKSYAEVVEKGPYQSRPFTKRLSGALGDVKGMPQVAFAALWDYLDKDRVPLSLSIPTTERVPMICGIAPELNGNWNFAVAKTSKVDWNNVGSQIPDQYAPANWQQQKTRTATRTDVYRIDPTAIALNSLKVNVTLVYPFRHDDGKVDDDKDDDCKFSVDGFVALFLSDPGMELRAKNAISELRYADCANLTKGDVQNGIIQIPLKAKSVTLPKNINKPEDAVIGLSLSPVNLSPIASKLNGNSCTLLTIQHSWTQNDTTPAGSPSSWVSVDYADPETAPSRSVAQMRCDFLGLNTSGATITKMTTPSFLGGSLQLNMAVWVRVLDNNNKVVDLAPACVYDDQLNGSSNYKDLQSRILLEDHFGSCYPLLRFDTGVSFKYDVSTLASLAQPISVSPVEGIVVADPRHNHAPESWFESKISFDAQGQWWLNQNGATRDAACDGDIFMTTSDQCELQSIYELANLPRFSNEGFYSFKNTQRGGLDKPDSTTLRNNSFQSSGSEANRGMMWRTYDPFGDRYKYSSVWHKNGDGFDELNVVSRGKGFLMNPYSDNTNSIMSVFANAPHSWRHASENFAEDVGCKNNAMTFNATYSWSGVNTQYAQIKWDDLNEFAEEFMDVIRKNSALGDTPEETWDKVYREKMNWAIDASATDFSKQLLEGLDLRGTSDRHLLYNTDKKFLYGFWHDSFAAKQQLFLVFVRAEPKVMGSGSSGSVPPQLGGRAVALVWRNPESTNKAGSDGLAPHKTRILFYRQME